MYSISEFGKQIGVCNGTLRLWDKAGTLKPAFVSPGGTRYYSDEQLNNILKRDSGKKLNVKQDKIEELIQLVATLSFKLQELKEESIIKD